MDWKKWIWLPLVFLFVLALAGILYVRMGGLNKVEITVRENVSKNIYGYKIADDETHLSVEKKFVSLKPLLTNGEIQGGLCLLYKNESDKPKDELPFFLGIITSDNQFPIDSCQHTVLHFQKVITAHITGHAAVRPSASQVLDEIRSFSETNKLHVEKKSVEIYYGPDILEVWVPINDKRANGTLVQ